MTSPAHATGGGPLPVTSAAPPSLPTAPTTSTTTDPDNPAQPTPTPEGSTTLSFHSYVIAVPTSSPAATFRCLRRTIKAAAAAVRERRATELDLDIVYGHPAAATATPRTAAAAAPVGPFPEHGQGGVPRYVGDFDTFEEALARTGAPEGTVAGWYVEGLLSLEGHFAESVVAGVGCRGCRAGGGVCRVLVDGGDDYVTTRSCGACKLGGVECGL